jgi:hypothetical protein
MPRALSERRVKGVFERPKDSNIWWIDYSVNGAHVREKIGLKSDAVKAQESGKGRSCEFEAPAQA